MKGLKPRVGLTLGDPAGIGPEVVGKALERWFQQRGSSEVDWVVYGRRGYLDPFLSEGVWNRITLCEASLGPESGPPVAGSEVSGCEAMSGLKAACDAACLGEVGGIVTAPVNKEAIIRSGWRDFKGQTEWLSERARAERTGMMLLGCDDRGRWLRVILVTTHLPLREVAGALKAEEITLKIGLAQEACRRLRLKRERLVVCGLNPHAGEGGTVGDEEIRVIGPAVEAAKALGIDVVGPWGADTVFYKAFRGDFEVVVAMYHDQGLGPLKMIGFERGVNWTVGLPFVRTSPDHGTAYDIAGKGIADPSSQFAAMETAVDLLRGT